MKRKPCMKFFTTWFGKTRGLRLFASELIDSPRSIGAAIPSSKILAEAMAAHIPDDKLKQIIELGAGTGVVTQAILKRGVKDQNLVVVEKSKKMCLYLRQHFPSIHVICGDAAQLNMLLTLPHNTASAIVSSLPLRALPKQVVASIISQIEKALCPGGVFIQFTYFIGRRVAPVSSKLKLTHTQHVWYNFPPARIDIYEVEK